MDIQKKCPQKMLVIVDVIHVFMSTDVALVFTLSTIKIKLNNVLYWFMYFLLTVVKNCRLPTFFFLYPL